MRVTYFLCPDGYGVEVIDNDGQPIEQYRAGNHPLDSQVYLAPDTKGRVRKGTLLKWAKQTARGYANEYKIPPNLISRDTDRETSLLEAWNERV